MLKKEAARAKDERTGYAPLQHRHFATIATIIREVEDEEAREFMADHFADRLGKTNPQFNRDRFLDACKR